MCVEIQGDKCFSLAFSSAQPRNATQLAKDTAEGVWHWSRRTRLTLAMMVSSEYCILLLIFLFHFMISSIKSILTSHTHAISGVEILIAYLHDPQLENQGTPL
jgi:hypothetical protein